jgi:hypothetical protein
MPCHEIPQNAGHQGSETVVKPLIPAVEFGMFANQPIRIGGFESSEGHIVHEISEPEGWLAFQGASE